MSGAGDMVRHMDGVSPASASHIPVLLQEVIAALAPRDGGVYVDGTFGAGGYSRAMLEAADCRIVAIDRDPDAIAHADVLRTQYKGRAHCLTGCFGDMLQLLEKADFTMLDGVMFDLGVSSMQLDQAVRGFSFLRDGPLDMRMSRAGLSAEELLNEATPELLTRIMQVYGEERRARAIVRAIVARRASARLTRTHELAEIVCGVLGQPRGRQAHPATRTFQALRIYLNDELGELCLGLAAAETLLRPGGRLGVVTFHSLEDRIVKQFFAIRTGRAGRPSRHLPDIARPAASFVETRQRSIKAAAAELAQNPRARSARLRVGERTHAPIYPGAVDLLPRHAPRVEGHV